MTMPPLPGPGDTSWNDDWGQAVHDAATAVVDGRLAAAALAETIRDTIGAALVAGSNVTITVNDAGDQITVAATGGGGSPTWATMPAGSVGYVLQNADGTWPNRITSRTDILVFWVKRVAGSSDPASATSPAVTGAYANDVVVGV